MECCIVAHLRRLYQCFFLRIHGISRAILLSHNFSHSISSDFTSSSLAHHRGADFLSQFNFHESFSSFPSEAISTSTSFSHATFSSLLRHRSSFSFGKSAKKIFLGVPLSNGTLKKLLVLFFWKEGKFLFRKKWKQHESILKCVRVLCSWRHSGVFFSGIDVNRKHTKNLLFRTPKFPGLVLKFSLPSKCLCFYVTCFSILQC